MTRRKTVILGLAYILLLASGCVNPEPQIIIQTRIVERMVEKAVTVTPAGLQTPTMTPVPSMTPSPTATSTPSPTATSVPPIRLLWPPDIRAEEHAELRNQLIKAIAQYTGWQIEGVVPKDEQEAIRALCTGQAEMAWLSTPAYLLAHEECGAEARLCALRNGSATYRAQIIVQTDAARRERKLAPISSLEDLRGKAIGFVDPLSPTGYLIPKALLESAGIVPESEVFLGGEAQAVLGVYQGELDAAATYWSPIQPNGTLGDARALLLDSHPDVDTVVKILSLTDPIPNDPVVFRDDLAPEVRDRLIAALVGMAETEEGRQALPELYAVSGLASVSDRQYDIVRAVGEELKLDWRAVLEGRYSPGEPATR